MGSNRVKPLVLFLVGPTAVGKSKVALALAKKLKGEILSADSMQVYRGMDIGTAKPSRAERRAVRHYLIDVLSPARNFSVHDYCNRALKVLTGISARGCLPIVVGGSGLYVRALLEGLSEKPGADSNVRRLLERKAKESGIGTLYAELSERDPKRAREIKPTDQKRIVRALEIILTSGKKVSDLHGQKVGLRDLGYEPIVIGLTRDRQDLYAAIERRVDGMFRRGLVREVGRLLRKGMSKTARQAVGYKEVITHLKGETDLDEAKAEIKKRSRHLAKRQWTWFKRERGIEWFEWKDVDDVKSIVDKILTKTPLGARRR